MALMHSFTFKDGKMTGSVYLFCDIETRTRWSYDKSNWQAFGLFGAMGAMGCASTINSHI
jgi:hypothetical protein